MPGGQVDRWPDHLSKAAVTPDGGARQSVEPRERAVGQEAASNARRRGGYGIALTMKVIAIDHVQLAMPPGGEAAARRFYGDVLGFVELAKPEAMRSRGGLWFQAGPLRGRARPPAKPHDPTRFRLPMRRSLCD
jgi:hypothetical protein